MKTSTIYVDESGTLPDPNDQVVIVAAVGTDSVEKVERFLKRVKKYHFPARRSSELKYYTAGERTKRAFVSAITKEDFIICTLTVEKMGRKIPDTPENYAALCVLLLLDVFQFCSGVNAIIFDRHFTNKRDTDEFNTILNKRLNKPVSCKYVDSMKDKRVNIADMVAGAMLATERGKDTSILEGFDKIITSKRRVRWLDVKKRFLTTKKLA